MTLDKYKEKRNFENTSEPEGQKQEQHKKHKEHRFVVQRHAATRLHYDFRLEMEGVLKSWAVPKGPSLNPADKRLAVRVEDHPYDYRTFEGKIPEGNYGAGQVEIWDEGTFEPLKRVDGKTDEEILTDALNKESLKIILHGEKLKGEFALFKMHTNQQNNWLLVKHKDQYAVNEPYDAENYTQPSSKVTKAAEKRYKNYKTPQAAISKAGTSSQHTNKINKEEQTGIKPMLANIGNGPFDSDEWIFEIKWDGYRAIADLTDDPLLYSRSGISFAEKYPQIFIDLKSQEHQMILDGEVVAYDSNGKPDF